MADPMSRKSARVIMGHQIRRKLVQKIFHLIGARTMEATEVGRGGAVSLDDGERRKH